MGAGRLLGRTSQLEVELSQDQKTESHDQNTQQKRYNFKETVWDVQKG